MQVFDLFATKMLNLGIFTRQSQKVIVLFEIATLEFMKFQSFSQQKKLSSKNGFLREFRWEFERKFFIFEISIMESVKMQSFIQNKKMLLCGPKMTYFGTFRQKFEKKTIFIFGISTFEFADTQSFILKEKRTSFWLKLPYLGIFELEFEKTIVITESSTLEFMQNNLLTNILKRRVHFS